MSEPASDAEMIFVLIHMFVRERPMEHWGTIADQLARDYELMVLEEAARLAVDPPGRSDFNIAAVFMALRARDTARRLLPGSGENVGVDPEPVDVELLEAVNEIFNDPDKSF